MCPRVCVCLVLNARTCFCSVDRTAGSNGRSAIVNRNTDSHVCLCKTKQSVVFLSYMLVWLQRRRMRVVYWHTTCTLGTSAQQQKLAYRFAMSLGRILLFLNNAALILSADTASPHNLVARSPSQQSSSRVIGEERGVRVEDGSACSFQSRYP